MTEFSDGALGIDSVQREKAAYESNGKTTNGNMSFMTLKVMLKNLYLSFECFVATASRKALRAYRDSFKPIRSPRGLFFSVNAVIKYMRVLLIIGKCKNMYRIPVKRPT